MTLRDFPLITTVIPTYKRPDCLKKAIESVLDQTYPHFQINVYDNASGDTTAAVVAEYAKQDSRIKYYCHEATLNAVENFQYGLNSVTTPFFSLLADDDLLLPHFYQTAMDRFKQYLDASFFMGAVIDVTEQREVIDVALSRWKEKEFYLPPEGLLEMIGKYSNWTGVLFRREVLEKVGGLDPHLKAIDVDYMLRAASCCSFIVCKQPCALFVQHPNSYSWSHRLKILWPGWQRMIEKVEENPDLLPPVKGVVCRQLQKQLQQLLFTNAVRSVERRQFDEAITFLTLLDKKIKKRALAIVIVLFKVFPPSYAPFALLFKLRRVLLKVFVKSPLQSEYQKWLYPKCK